jgi:hypothetical protein
MCLNALGLRLPVLAQESWLTSVRGCCGPFVYCLFWTRVLHRLQVIPKQPGFERRVEIYKLYHYLNHLNLFGSGYRGSCTAIIDKYV